jgi:hypothetical protein
VNQYIEFDYETLKGQTLTISGKTDGTNVKFIAYLNGDITSRSFLTTIDVRNIEEFIVENAQIELNYFDLDYRNER